MEKKIHPISTRLSDSEDARVGRAMEAVGPLCEKRGPFIRVLILIGLSAIEAGIVNLETNLLQGIQSQIRLRPASPLRIEPERRKEGAA